MRIGIDIDDVIVDTSLAMKEYIEKFNENKDIYEHMEDVIRGEAPTKNIERFFKENMIDIFRSCKIKENAKKVIQNLINNGNEIFIITARGDKKDIFKGVKKVSLEFLKSNDIKYTKILFNSYNKAIVCEKNKIDVMIDDSIKHCENVQNKNNIKTILFTSEVNKNIETKLTRVNNWLELEEIINKM